MARYRRIDVCMWGDEKFRALSAPPPNGRDCWVHLLTNRETGIIPGVYRAYPEALARDLGWPLEGYREAFGEVFREGMAKADWKAGLVLIPGALKRNPPQSPNVVTSWREAWNELPECELKDEAFQHVKAFVEGMGKAFGEAFGKAFGNLCQTKIRIRIQDQERGLPPASPPALSLDASPPKKRERPKAPPLPFTAAQALEAVSQAAGSAFTRPAGQLPKGQVIALQAHVRAFPELASWTALGRYLAAGRASHLRDPGPSWLASANLPEVMTRALAWESSGRPAATPAAKFATPVITGRVIPTIAETEAMIARQREDAKNAVAPPKEFLEMARRLTADIEEA